MFLKTIVQINLRHGMLPHLVRQKDTCTACGGTMLLEMAALSRMTGNPVYEQKVFLRPFLKLVL